jgi:signal transduction histidine kinase
VDKWKILLLLCILFLIGALFALDCMTPLNTAAWLPYFVVIPLTLWLPGRRYTYLAAGLATAFTLAGVFMSPPGGAVWRAVINRLIAIGAFWITAFEGLAARRTHELEKANQALKEEIARRERLESQLLRTQRLESIGTLAGGIAHDFNNLLTPILMSVKLLQEDRDEDERQRLLSALQVSAERGAQMVKQLLSFAGG